MQLHYSAIPRSKIPSLGSLKGDSIAADTKARRFRSLSDKSLQNGNMRCTSGRAVNDVGKQKSNNYGRSLSFSPKDVQPSAYQAAERVESELNYREVQGHFQGEQDTLQVHQAQAHYQQQHGKPNWSHYQGQVHFGSLHGSYGHESMSPQPMWKQQGPTTESYHNPITSHGLPMHNYQARGIQGGHIYM